MSHTATQSDLCQQTDVSAYIDGELDAASSVLFEDHIKSCVSCAATLTAQKRLLCLLDDVMSEPRRGGTEASMGRSLPKNFAKEVTARAQSDMSGVRQPREHKRALLLSVALAASAFALLGASSFGAAFAPAAALAGATGCVFSVAGRFATDAVSTLVVIVRAAGGYFLIDPLPVRSFTWLLLVAGVALLLLRMIASYHRARASE
ncbi:MAG: zf-HC2 domain-containing protein [Acidobacteriota bacterium]|nr:zf-HC2 domain-containing protein [Acidobacteriota bacterium]